MLRKVNYGLCKFLRLRAGGCEFALKPTLWSALCLTKKSGPVGGQGNERTRYSNFRRTPASPQTISDPTGPAGHSSGSEGGSGEKGAPEKAENRDGAAPFPETESGFYQRRWKTGTRVRKQYQVLALMILPLSLDSFGPCCPGNKNLVDRKTIICQSFGSNFPNSSSSSKCF